MNSNKIVSKFLMAQNQLVIQSSDLSLESIANMVEKEAIDISPKYQRRERWTKEKQSALIESFLLNIPVPPIYLAEDEYGKYSVIDGKQRITSIYNFIKKQTALSSLKKFAEIENLTFNQLPSQLKNALSIRPYIRVITLLKQSDKNLKYEVFTRLNTGGDVLLPQEIRNVAFRGKLNDLIIDLAEDKFLNQQLKIKSKSSKLYKEMVDVEYVLRFFTLIRFWDKFPGNMRNAMDSFMEENHKNDAPLYLEKIKQTFLNSISTCKEIWGEDAFKRPDGRNQLVQGVFDAQMVPISFFALDKQSKLIENKEKIKDSFYKAYSEDKDFEEAIRQFTSNAERVYYRINKMKTIIEEIIM